MSRIIAISDIHGHAKTFKKLIKKKLKLKKKDKLFLLGDYVHRGPSNEGVFDYILKLQLKGYQVECLLGNHEFLWLKQLSHKGGQVPKKYLDFLRSCKFYMEYENLIFVHGGLDFKAENPFANRKDLLWMRNWYESIDYEWLGERRIIHGHTPMKASSIRKRVNERQQAIGIDNGCFVTSREEMGRLCAFDITNWKLYFQKNIDISK
jgi:serine/threonine protein phosphatase 1